MSGSLQPCIPLKFCLKFDPPKITLIYQFQSQTGKEMSSEQYYHEMLIEKNKIETQTEDDICSYLFMAEGYYLDPK